MKDKPSPATIRHFSKLSLLHLFRAKDAAVLFCKNDGKAVKAIQKAIERVERISEKNKKKFK